MENTVVHGILREGILTTVSPVYVKIQNYAKYWFNEISQISSRAGIK